MSAITITGYIVWVEVENRWHWLRKNDAGKYVQFLEFYDCEWVQDKALLFKDRVNWVRGDFALQKWTKARPE